MGYLKDYWPKASKYYRALIAKQTILNYKNQYKLLLDNKEIKYWELKRGTIEFNVPHGFNSIVLKMNL